MLNWRHEGRTSGCGRECFSLFVFRPVCAILDVIEIGENIHKINICHERVLPVSSYVVILDPCLQSCTKILSAVSCKENCGYVFHSTFT